MKVSGIAILATFALGLAGAPSTAQADFKRICRGANLPAYRVEMKNAVKAKLRLAGIPFRNVQVNYTNIVRAQDVAAPDFVSGLKLSDGLIPTVTFTDALPAVTGCNVTGKLRIRVAYPDGVTITKTDFSAPGTMLFKSRVRSDGGLGGDPSAD